LPGAEPLRAETLQKFRNLTAPLLGDLSPVPAAATAATTNATAAAGPLAVEPPASSVSAFSVSSILDDSRSTLGDNRPQISVN
jgi:hypothetical protein